MENTTNCQNSADVILYNGKIYSGDDKQSIYEAVAVCQDKICALGTTADILALKDKMTDLTDLHGKTVIPGLIDTHTHFSTSALTEVRGGLYIPGSIKELLEYIKKKAHLINKGEWLYFGGVYPVRLEEQRYPTLEELDKAAPDHPVYINGILAGQANTCALKLTGIDEATVPETGMILKDTTGKINGRLLGCGYLVDKCIDDPAYTEEETARAIQMLQKEYNRFGITSVIDAATSINHINAYNILYSQKKLNIRLIYSLIASKLEDIDNMVSDFRGAINTPTKWGKLCFMKVFIDGGILTGTSYMRKPLRNCSDLFGISDGAYHGFINYEADELVKYIKKADDTGLQMTAHSIGDAATDRFVEAYEKASRHNSVAGKRHAITHATFTDIRTIQRIKKLGLTLISQPAWHYMDSSVISRVLDEDALKSFLPYNDMELLGVTAAAGSDHMMKHDSLLSQNPFNPFLGLYNLITRKNRKREELLQEQKVSRRTALKMYTRNGAYATFDDELKGTLEVGKLADMAVLTKDYFTCNEEEIPYIESVLTMVGGRIVYEN